MWRKIKSFFGGNLNQPFEKHPKERVEYKQVSNTETSIDDTTVFNHELRRIDDILTDIGFRLIHLKILFIIGLLNMTDSLEVSIFSILLPRIRTDWSLSSLQAGVLTFSLSIGIAIGCSFWGWISDRYGRKIGFIGSACFIMIFGFTSAFITNYYCFWITLCLTGFGISNIYETSVVILEVSPPKYRCIVGVLLSAFWSLGFFVSAITSAYITTIPGNQSLAFVCIPTGLFLASVIFLPETPHYYLTEGNEQKALDTLQKFAPEMDFTNVRLQKCNVVTKRANLTEVFLNGYWKVTTCCAIALFSIWCIYYSVIYMVSEIAAPLNFTQVPEHPTAITQESDLYNLMVWMHLPEVTILCIFASMCWIMTVKNSLLLSLICIIAIQIVESFFLNERTAFFLMTMITRSLAMTASALCVIFIPLLYPTETRALGLGVCASFGRVGMMSGPFLFETYFQQFLARSIVYNIGMTLIAILGIILLPSPTNTEFI